MSRTAARTRQQLDRRWRAALSDTIAEGQRAGELPASVQPARVALMLASLMDGLAVQFALGDAEVSAERMTETLMFAAERALGCELAPGRPRSRGWRDDRLRPPAALGP